MAYAVTNPPALYAQGVMGKGKLWIYKSTDDENSFDDTDYITNARDLGMTTGDSIILIDSTNGLLSHGKVTLDADGNATVTALTAIA